jgi:peptidoglycan-N-acetylglucosamine deacetylase
MAERIVNAMSVDIEDYYQVQAFAGQVAADDWTSYPSRIVENTDRVLDLFARSGVRATFFVLGWAAERHPAMVRKIVAAGHEIASHGYNHRRVFEQTPDEFRADVRKTKSLLEDASGQAVDGYRAASFSIDTRTPWAFAILAEEGHRYSTSLYPIRHDHYGAPDAPRHPYRPLERAAFLEIPITTATLAGRRLPAGGGGYFRLLPYFLSRRLIDQVNRAERRACIFYFHPWELDPDQPRLSGAPFRSRFRHYVRLDSMEARLERLLGEFLWGRIDDAFSADLRAPHTTAQ